MKNAAKCKKSDKVEGKTMLDRLDKIFFFNTVVVNPFGLRSFEGPVCEIQGDLTAEIGGNGVQYS